MTQTSGLYNQFIIQRELPILQVQFTAGASGLGDNGASLAVQLLVNKVHPGKSVRGTDGDSVEMIPLLRL